MDLPQGSSPTIETLTEEFPQKFIHKNSVFSNIHRGDTIFIGTGCAEPQHLIKILMEYVESNPKVIFDAEVMHVWTLGIAPYTDEKFKSNFRHNTFFIGNNTRDAVNDGLADYTPIFLSEVPKLFEKKIVPIDVALIQTSLPDKHGHLSLGVSVDIVKSAVEVAKTVIVQINPQMPRVLGDSFIHMNDVDYAIYHDEDLIELPHQEDRDDLDKIGKHVSNLVQDGDTIQVGYGTTPNAILKNLKNKKHLGVHTELISDGIVELMRKGVIDNSRKTINKGKTIASFCMASKSTYEYLHDNPAIEFHPIQYTNNPLNIAQHKNMVAINSCLEIDLTGQATATSIGHHFYSGIGGHADFMRGTILAPGGRTILTVKSTTNDGKFSRIVPFLAKGAGTSLIRGDIHYVVTEYGIAYLHGKNIRQQAMELIGIANPKFRPGLIKEAKKYNLIYKNQAFIPGKRGEYPAELEAYRTTSKKQEIFFRPIKPSDEGLLKKFFYSLSDDSMYKRFISTRKDMPHERLQEFTVIDYTQEVVIIASVKEGDNDVVVGLGQYGVHGPSHTGEVAFVVREKYQNRGIASELLSYLTLLARRQGLLGFTAEVLVHNKPMLHLFESNGFEIQRHKGFTDSSCHQLAITFRGSNNEN